MSQWPRSGIELPGQLKTHISNFKIPVSYRADIYSHSFWWPIVMIIQFSHSCIINTKRLDGQWLHCLFEHFCFASLQTNTFHFMTLSNFHCCLSDFLFRVVMIWASNFIIILSLTSHHGTVSYLLTSLSVCICLTSFQFWFLMVIEKHQNIAGHGGTITSKGFDLLAQIICQNQLSWPLYHLTNWKANMCQLSNHTSGINFAFLPYCVK